MAVRILSINTVAVTDSTVQQALAVSDGEVQGLMWDGHPVLWGDSKGRPRVIEYSKKSHTKELKIFNCSCGEPLCNKIKLTQETVPHEAKTARLTTMHFINGCTTPIDLGRATRNFRQMFSKVFPRISGVVEVYFTRTESSVPVIQKSELPAPEMCTLCSHPLSSHPGVTELQAFAAAAAQVSTEAAMTPAVSQLVAAASPVQGAVAVVLKSAAKVSGLNNAPPYVTPAIVRATKRPLSVGGKPPLIPLPKRDKK